MMIRRIEQGTKHIDILMKRPFWKSKMDKMMKRNFQTESVGKVGQRGGLLWLPET